MRQRLQCMDRISVRHTLIHNLANHEDAESHNRRLMQLATDLGDARLEMIST